MLRDRSLPFVWGLLLPPAAIASQQRFAPLFYRAREPPYLTARTKEGSPWLLPRELLRLRVSSSLFES